MKLIQKRKIWIISIAALLILLIMVPQHVRASDHYPALIPDRSEYGLYNTQILQEAVDKAFSEGGGIVSIPPGTYYFASAGKNVVYPESGQCRQSIGEHVIVCRDHVAIQGSGRDLTILKPVGITEEGLDMFYYNPYRDSGYKASSYLKKVSFQDFTIDSSDTGLTTYRSAGKGFMIKLCKECSWKNITVMNTDATGFGIDFPIQCEIAGCIAKSCGKAAGPEANGASGFGIGIGYSAIESMTIHDCVSVDNRKFGFFTEHQGRFNEYTLYKAPSVTGIHVLNCVTGGNLYGFGGIHAVNTHYEHCASTGTDKLMVYFDEFSHNNFLE